MRRTLITTSLATALIAMTSSAQAADNRLTIYSGDFDAVTRGEVSPGGPGFALVDRSLGFDLKAGDNAVQLAGMPRALDASSVVLKPLGAASVRGQRFDFALAGQDDLLRRAIGQPVSVEQAVGNDRQTIAGVLMSAGNGLTLRLPDGRIKVLSSYSSFELPRLPTGVVNEPTMSWVLTAPRAGNEQFRLAYGTAGLAWRAEYNVSVSGQGKDCRLDLEGAAMVANRSGADFDNVRLTLVAGEPNRVTDGQEMMPMAAAAPMARSKMMMADSAPAARASGEYQAYTLPDPGSLPQGSVQRLPLVNPTQNVACERRYETQAEVAGWTPPYPMVEPEVGSADGQEQDVIATLRFRNSKTGGLGIPLPAGRVRMREGSDFLGEASLGHTAVNADVALAIGKSFDLGAKRTREEFKIDRVGRTMTETVAVTVRNGKTNAVTVRVGEGLPRWSDWDIVTSTVSFEKTDARNVRFDVPVPAGGETTLRYTVRYRWAADVKIPN